MENEFAEFKLVADAIKNNTYVDDTCTGDSPLEKFMSSKDNLLF